ncbi:MAG: transcriptional regulator [Desulfovibrionaceae bacterium]|nr:transcriptional regulator [Desulfovibrionaceae bacterium]
MFKILIVLIVGYVLYRMFKNDFLKRKQVDAEEEKKSMDEKIAHGEMVKDPECGTYVSKDCEITVRDGSVVHHFCSYDCREKFLNRLREGGRQIPEHKADE